MKLKKKALQKFNANNKRIEDISNLDLSEILLNHPITGLNLDEVEKNRDEYGENKIATKKRQSWFVRLLKSFIDPFSLVLITLGIVTIFTDIIFPQSGKSDFTAVIIIFMMVIISAGLQFFQETKSVVAFEKLTEMVETTTLIEREGVQHEIPLDEVVVFDVIHLKAGDIIPADARLVYSKDLFVSQSSLTGESQPIEKSSSLKQKSYKTVTDRENLLFMGTSVDSGYGIAIVIAVGDSTFFGKIATKLSEKREKTAFEKGIKSISMLLLRITVVVVPLVLIINGLIKNDWIEALLFAISVAVGLTPEMLPTIVAASLAKGANTMSKKKVIIKKLNSIQNFGGMDILCTDKTGTLTQDRVIVERHLDVSGKNSIRVLRHAYLNSYFQTGLKNLLDLSIIEKKDELSLNNPELQIIQSHYRKVDEIPFDFKRRRLSVVLEDQNKKTQMITKGAIEEILSVCTFVEYNDKVVPLDEKMRQIVLKQADRFNDQGYRVIGVAQKTNPSGVGIFSVEDENDMVLIGILTFFDPPKDSTEEAIRQIKEYGVQVKILTGDNEKTTAAICKMVGIPVEKILLGNEIQKMSDEDLIINARDTDVFAKVSPTDKARVVKALKDGGHVVGFMGDGINDAPALKEADVSVTVDNAADIAKESADIVLLEKDLNVLKNGIIEGRKTFGNIMKYINMTVSSNFGNIISILVASIFLPFLPMFPIQLLLLNLINDLIFIAVPWDNVAESYLKTPKTINTKAIFKYMLMFGPISSIFDISTFALMYFVLAPQMMGGSYQSLSETNQLVFANIFRTGWFIESLFTQVIFIYLMRTEKIFKDRPGTGLIITSVLGLTVVSVLPYIPTLNTALDFEPLSGWIYLALVATFIAYAALVLVEKKIYYRQPKIIKNDGK